MRANGICMVTGDVARLSSFYADALGVRVQGDDPSASICAPGAALSLGSEAGIEEMAAGGLTLEVEVADLDEQSGVLKQLGCPVVEPPTTQP